MTGNMTVWLALAALALSVLGGATGVAFFGGRIFERLAHHHDRLTVLEAADASAAQLRETMARIEAEVRGFGKRLDEMSADLRARFGAAR